MEKTKKAFVLMPFKEPYESYYEEVFKPALQEASFEVSRADDLSTPGPVILDIQQSIMEADLILCEMSGRNPNVFYELGLTHAIGKPAILVSQSEEDIPFDIRHMRVFLYDRTATNWAEELRKSITEAAKSIRDAGKLWPLPMVQSYNEPYHPFPRIMYSMIPTPYDPFHLLFRLTNEDSQPVYVLVTANIYLGDRKIGHPEGDKEGYYSGREKWNLNPGMMFQGHFRLPEVVSKSTEQLVIGFELVAIDYYGKEYDLLPVKWTYNRDKKIWVAIP